MKEVYRCPRENINCRRKLVKLIHSTNVLCVVSLDGSIRSPNTDEVLTAIEIKCPFPSDKQPPVHYKLPEYKVCRYLAEIAALNTDQLLYISYSKASMTVFRVLFSAELWQTIWDLVKTEYDREISTKPTRNHPNLKTIKPQIKEFTNRNVQFFARFPHVSLSLI
ncbi:hypothetical protein FSP39_019142 [Pinctada imbricata]|uniref:YqaJ viral recombinase domain-containing protein n=1 Tax=Pinctada imbricata TaxID=66713 RepID=A0AA89BQ83_PINIB|nr:hypothetical protein FSP39_019142 [Pinctada imbricata]